MTNAAFYEKTRKRLEKYAVFAKPTLDFAAHHIQKQATFDTYQEFFNVVDVPLQPTLFMNERGQGGLVVDISSRESVQKGVLVVHLPMGNSLDPNQLYQVATLAHAFAAYRIIAFGNPSGKPYAHREENLSLKDWWNVAFTKNLRAAVSIELDYLDSQDIKDAYFVGYSFGALKALLAAEYGDSQRVRGLVLIDPVAHPRGLRQLIRDFKATFVPLGDYVNRNELQTFHDARGDAARYVGSTSGLVRPVNIAIGCMLARTDFMSRLQKTLQKHPTLTANVAWGSESELGNDVHMKEGLHELAQQDVEGRVRSLRLEGDTHAFANDLALYTAIVHDALS